MKVYDNRVHCYPYACWKREGQVPDANRHSICATITITIKYTVKNNCKNTKFLPYQRIV